MGEEIRAKDIIPIFQVFMAMFQARFYCIHFSGNIWLSFSFTKSAIKPVTGRRTFKSKACFNRHVTVENAYLY
jgi:hypothetical protein